MLKLQIKIIFLSILYLEVKITILAKPNRIEKSPQRTKQKAYK